MNRSLPRSPRLRGAVAWPLALALAVLIVYASLHPFNFEVPAQPLGWRQLLLPWPARAGRFDVVINVAGYAPLGLLLTLGWLARGRRPLAALLLAVLAGALLSWAMENLQNFVPVRVPSRMDLALNALGTLLGALLALGAQGLGWTAAWAAQQRRWVDTKASGTALALLLLWPVGLLFPNPVPLGLGQMATRVHAHLVTLVAGSSFEDWVVPLDPVVHLGVSSGTEVLVTALGLVAPCLVAFTIVRGVGMRIALALGAAALGLATTSLSTALSLQPDRMFSWVSRSTPYAAALAALVLAALLPLSRRTVAVAGLVLVTALLFLVNEVPIDPFLADSLERWNRSPWVRFNGLAQWVGWFWPVMVLVWLAVAALRRVRDDE